MNEVSGYPVTTRSIFRRRRGWVLLLIVLLVGTTALALHLRPAPTYDVHANAKIWLADVHLALKEAGPGGRVKPTGPLRTISGVGPLQEVFVGKATLRKAVTVLFLTGINENAAGLAYVKGYLPPPDSCNFHLGGPWWQIAPQNKAGCPRGFSFTGAP